MSASPTDYDNQNDIVSWFARNHVAANLLMIFIIVIGLISLSKIQREFQPDLNIEIIQVLIAYPGAAPEEVEQGVTSKVEKAIKDIAGIEKMSSYSNEGLARLQINVMQGFEVSTLLDQIKNRIDGISNLPDLTEAAVIEQLEMEFPAIQLQVSGDLTEKQLNKILRGIEQDVLALPEISSVELFGLRDYEISIEVSEVDLKKYQLTLRDVANAINRSSIDMAGGAIQSNTGDILLRTQGQAFNQNEFNRIVLRSFADGSRLYLSDVAYVRDAFTQRSGLTSFDGKYGAGLMVYAIGDQDVIDTTNIIKRYVEKKQLTLADNIELSYWQDFSHYIEERMDLMGKNLTIGALLVFLILLVFLNFNLAFWVMAGLPVCFLGTVALMQMSGVNVSLNMISLFGFITVLGIMVDDAIIIGESIDSTTNKDGHNLNAVIKGVKRVAIPATFGVLTTVVSFLPTVTLDSVFAPFPAAMGWVVIFCLLFSLLESKLILPAHIAHSRLTQIPLLTAISQRTNRFSARTNVKLNQFIDQLYLPFLKRCLVNRYTTLASFIGALIITGGILASGIVLLVVMPNVPSEILGAKVEMIEGTPNSQTENAVDQITEALYQANQDYIQDSGDTNGFIKHFYTWGTPGDYAEFMLELTKVEHRSIDSYEIIQRWRKNAGDITGTKSLVFRAAEEMLGDPISFNISADTREELVAASTELEQIIASYEGVYDSKSSLNNQVDELKLNIKPSAEALGLSLSDLGGQVRDAFYGIEAQRIQRGTDEVKVMVRYPREDRKALADLDTMFIRTMSGDTVPFYSVADITSQPSYASIEKINGRRAVNISAKVDKLSFNPDAISRQIITHDFPQLIAKYPSLRFEMEGEAKDSADIVNGLTQGFILAIIAVYALLAIPLKSYTQPLIIMAIIPFSLIGAIAGHLIMDTAFSMMSFFGVIALIGVAVNDSLILTDAVNQQRAEGQSITDAVLASCKRRFRAILLTSLTTFFGLFPMLLETSLQAQVIQPMAISLAFGIVFATVITLLLIPCLFLILNDIQEREVKSLSNNEAVF
ncbi:MAG TPA: acriflavin resistance protein [Cellvibrionales bacterium]|jgi:multidrug efflux pump subunit AcrB|nr:acriflavin resistance protein [Cellvibrionales bacterium]